MFVRLAHGHQVELLGDFAAVYRGSRPNIAVFHLEFYFCVRSTWQVSYLRRKVDEPGLLDSWILRLSIMAEEDHPIIQKRRRPRVW